MLGPDQGSSWFGSVLEQTGFSRSARSDGGDEDATEEHTQPPDCLAS